MITKLWRWLFGGCEHKWQIIRQGILTDDHYDAIGTFYIVRCEKCGKIKRKK